MPGHRRSRARRWMYKKTRIAKPQLGEPTAPRGAAWEALERCGFKFFVVTDDDGKEDLFRINDVLERWPKSASDVLGRQSSWNGRHSDRRVLVWVQINWYYTPQDVKEKLYIPADMDPQRMMHWCPRPRFRRAYHHFCLLNNGHCVRVSGIEEIQTARLTSSPNKDNNMTLADNWAACLPTELVELAAQPIVRGGEFGIAGNVAAVVLACRWADQPGFESWEDVIIESNASALLGNVRTKRSKGDLVVLTSAFSLLPIPSLNRHLKTIHICLTDKPRHNQKNGLDGLRLLVDQRKFPGLTEVQLSFYIEGHPSADETESKLWLPPLIGKVINVQNAPATERRKPLPKIHLLNRRIDEVKGYLNSAQPWEFVVFREVRIEVQPLSDGAGERGRLNEYEFNGLKALVHRGNG
ncbi:hypothetical protein B0H10DRAFT_1944413 [Mycena sp. CBHHK59/15]|nr:hypothetical protein B0H10DRAFT_1944413 [Mycena sp. CBHHK59/15]